mmetsp:Transcript_2630/g.4843  ORF Transcript_2630/g.4843 Transcript_2630/m.4843 type:complete len:400 (-) Transcript_2630:210-1409(-)
MATEPLLVQSDEGARHSLTEAVENKVKDKFHHVGQEWNQTVSFINGVRHQTLDTGRIDTMAPGWIIDHAEKSCLSGCCLEIPCCDWYAPNTSGCCCCHPWYVEKEYEFQDFWKEVLPMLHTGDIVLAAWPTEDGLKASKFLTHSVWSHVGFIYRPSDQPDILKHRCEDYPEAHQSRPLVAQMLMGGDASHPSAFYMNDFEQSFKDYLDKFSNCAEPDSKSPFMISVRFLTGLKRDKEFYQKIEEAVVESEKKTYNMDPMSGVDLCSFWPCCSALDATDDPNTVFCSEFVALAYQKAGLINPKLNPAEFIPSMFDTSRYLWLRKGSLTIQHTVIGPRSKEERARYGYKGQPGYLCPKGYGDGIYGTDVTKPIQSIEYGTSAISQEDNIPVAQPVQQQSMG